MAEKFRKIVNAPHKAFRNARKRFTAMKPASPQGKAGRLTGIALSGMFQFMLWAAKYVALDNRVLRKMEKGLKGKTGFAGKHPNMSAHLLYYMMLGAMITGGNAAKSAIESTEEKESVKTEVVVQAPVGRDAVPVYEKDTYEAYLAKMRPVTPLLVAHLVSLEGVCMNEQGMHVVYDDATGKPLKPGEKAKGTATIGFGSTRLENGKAVTSRTPPKTAEEAYELVRHHIEEGETYFVLYCYEVGLGSVHFDSTQKAMMVASMVYNMGSSLIEEPDDTNHGNRFEELRNLYKEYGLKIPDAKVRELFEKYPVVNPTGFGKILLGMDKDRQLSDQAGMYLKAGGRLTPGLVYRRWVEAGLLSGDINPLDILEMPMAGLPEFYQVMCREVGGDKKKAFFTEKSSLRYVNRDTYKRFHQWIKNPVDRHGMSLKGLKKVRDYLPARIVQMCRSGQCEVGNVMGMLDLAQDNRKTKNVVTKKTAKGSYSQGAKKLENYAHTKNFGANELYPDEHDRD